MTTISYFVRDILGCDYPDDSQQSVILEFPRHLRCRLVMNDHFIIDVVEIDSFCVAMARLPQLVKDGRKLRDRLGMQRFRLVLSSHDPAKVRHGAYSVWGIQNTDANTHLHVIERAQCELHLPTRNSL